MEPVPVRFAQHDIAERYRPALVESHTLASNIRSTLRHAHLNGARDVRVCRDHYVLPEMVTRRPATRENYCVVPGVEQVFDKSNTPTHDSSAIDTKNSMTSSRTVEEETYTGTYEMDSTKWYNQEDIFMLRRNPPRRETWEKKGNDTYTGTNRER